MASLLVQPVVVCALFIFFTLASRWFVVPPAVLSPVWVPTGILMFALFRASSLRMAVADLIAAFLCSLFGNYISGIAFQPSAVFSVVNCFGGVLGAVLLRKKLGSSAHLDSIRNLGAPIVYGAGLTNAVSAVFGAAAVSGFKPGAFGPGKIRGRSKPGQGTVFQVALPLERRSKERLEDEMKVSA